MQLPPREPVDEESQASGREESEKSDVEDGGELALDELADYQGAARARIHQVRLCDEPHWRDGKSLG